MAHGTISPARAATPSSLWSLGRTKVEMSYISATMWETYSADRYGRWASYRLERSRYKEEGTPDITADNSGHKQTTTDAGGQVPGVTPEEDPALLAVADPARKQKRLDLDEMRRLIRSLCKGRYLTFRQLASLLNREPHGLQRWTLRPMAHDRQLLLAYPDTPNHPKQAYQTNPDWSES